MDKRKVCIGKKKKFNICCMPGTELSTVYA